MTIYDKLIIRDELTKQTLNILKQKSTHSNEIKNIQVEDS